MRVLLDTTALYVAAGLSPLAFTPAVRRLIEHPATVRFLSPVSVAEVAMKANRGLTPLRREHVERLIVDLDLTLLPFDPEHSFALFNLPGHHKDPFDRLLIATALAEDISLVAHDREFSRYEGLRILW